MYTKFISNPIVFIAVEGDHEFLISQGRNKPNMSSDSINFGPHNTNINCSNFYKMHLHIPVTHHHSHIALGGEMLMWHI